MINLSPKTIRGKLLFAYLALLCIFTGAGILMLTEIVKLRRSSETFFGQYNSTEDLIITTRFIVDEISNTVLSPPSQFDLGAYVLSTEETLVRLAQQFQASILPEQKRLQISESLIRYDEIINEPLELYGLPIQVMEQADKIADQCLLQAENINRADLVTAVAGIVDAYTDFLLTHSNNEFDKYLQLVNFIDAHPSVGQITSFPQFKKKAQAVFDVSTQYVHARQIFTEASSELAAQLADLDRDFHQDIFLPSQKRLEEQTAKIAWLVFIAIIFTIFISTLVSLLLGKKIWKPLEDLGEMVRMMSAGELNHRLVITGEDEVSLTGRELNRFADFLRETLERLDRQMIEMQAVQNDLKKSEEESRSLSREYQTVFDGISDALVVVDHERNIVWANEKASVDLYADIDKQVSVGEYDYKPGSFYDLGNDQVSFCFRLGEKLEELISREDGKHFRVKVFPLFDEQDKVNRVVKIVSDVSDQFLLREEADRSNRLASLGELSAGIAHEINNPNSLVLLNAPIAKEALEDVIPILEEKFKAEGDFQWGGLPYSKMREELPLMINEMYDGALRIQRIVDDLKNFVRTDVGSQKSNIDLNIAVETGVRLTRKLVEKKTDKFNCELKRRLPLIQGQHGNIEQVVVNLIQNACLALPDRNKGLTVRTAISDDEKHVLLIVEDEGVGIEQENLVRLTDPFFTTRRKDGGTGLGLSVSNRIIRDLGGQITFDSKPGCGTKVSVQFPIANNGE